MNTAIKMMVERARTYVIEGNWGTFEERMESMLLICQKSYSDISKGAMLATLDDIYAMEPDLISTNYTDLLEGILAFREIQELPDEPERAKPACGSYPVICKCCGIMTNSTAFDCFNCGERL